MPSATAIRADEFEFQRSSNKIGKPVDRTEWDMTPPTVNAYYDPQMNNINFPAGILQPPFFDNEMDDAVNFGGIGMVIGHELTHGFDDEGRQFDAKGNLHDWWTRGRRQGVQAARRLRRRRVLRASRWRPGVHINGKLTLGENTADNGGVADRADGADEHAGRQGRAEDRRLHAGAALLPVASARSGAPTSARKRCACRCRPIRTRPPNSA